MNISIYMIIIVVDDASVVFGIHLCYLSTLDYYSICCGNVEHLKQPDKHYYAVHDNPSPCCSFWCPIHR